MSNQLLPVACVSGVVLLFAGCGGPKTAPAPKPPPRLVLTTKVITRDEPLYLDEIGACTALESVSVQAQISGQIIKRDFADGAEVKKGDLLFTIDPRPYQAALDQAKGTLAQNKAQLALDKINLQRAQDLRTKNVNTPQDLDTAHTNVQTDQAKIESGQAAVDAAQVNLDFCDIRSPIDGRAGLRQVDVGNIVTIGSGTAVLLTIQRLDPIYTDFTVAESDMPQVRAHLPITDLKVETDLPDPNVPPKLGSLYFLDTQVQSGAGTVKARAVTPNPDHVLLPGAFVRVKLILETLKDARLVPNQTVQISQAGPYVFVVKGDNTLEQRPVKPGQRQGDLTVITEGLQPGETVVTSGQIALAPGIPVKAQPDPAYNKPGASADGAKAGLP